VSPSADIYSLGVILYELVTGHWPYRIENFRFDDIARAICESSPRRPSVVVQTTEHVISTNIEAAPAKVAAARECTPEELSRSLRGDIDDILDAALAKNPRARYRSVRLLSNDVKGYLDGQQISTPRDRTLTRVLNALGQHRTPVVAAGVMIATFPTGGIHIAGTGWVTILGAVLTLIFWWAATDANIGERIANSPILNSRKYVPALIIAVLLPCDVVGSQYAPVLASAILFLCTACIFTALVGWLERAKWAGRLLFDASQRRNPVVLSTFGLAFLAVILTRAVHLIRVVARPQSIDVMVCLALLAMVWLVSLAGGKLEFRERGIVWVGRLFRWNDIDGFEWEADIPICQQLFQAPVPGDVLKLRMTRMRRFPPPVRIPVPHERVPGVQVLLSRLLSDWPAMQ